MVLLNRFEVAYPRQLTSTTECRGSFAETGRVELGVGALVDLGEDPPHWVRSDDGRFSVKAGGEYLAPCDVKRPTVHQVRASGLRKRRHKADYVAIGPKAFLDAAAPLFQHRRRQGLRVKAVPVEEIVSEFGYGEARPEAIRDFVAYAYHEWRVGPRYVMLLGDATYDSKDHLKTGAVNHVPALPVETSYLWTVSDPSYGAVHGDDALPDLAVGRLPASSVSDVVTMVEKILAYERTDATSDAPVFLIADNDDGAGRFGRDALRLAHGVLSGERTSTILLDELGAPATRDAIVGAFEREPRLVSYLGHGGIHLWADERLFDTSRVATLPTSTRLPLVLTMNCLNGYFHFPYFDSLSEALVKAEGRGAIAAFSPSGLSQNAPAHRYHEALLQELTHGDHVRLGDAILQAQKSYLASGVLPELLQIFHLIGDPALTLD